MLKADSQLTWNKKHADGLSMLLGKKGFVTRIIPKLFTFTRAKFHPNLHDTKDLELLWKKRLFDEAEAA